MGNELRALLVEDSEDDARLLVREFTRAGYEVSWERVETAPEMRSALERGRWEIVIADYVMPRFSAPAALRLLREAQIDLPFIVVSGKVGEDVVVEAMKAGAHDYILKTNLTRLIPAVERELEQARHRRARREAETTIRQSAARLAASEERYRVLMEQANDAILLLDPEQRVVEANRQAECLLGRPRGEIIGRHYDDFVAPEEREDSAARRRALLSGETVRIDERRLLRPDGMRVTVEVSGSLVSVGPQPVLLEILRDVTERKRVEEALRRSEEQLREARRMETIATLAGGIAHEFNTLLNVVLADAERLSRRLPPGDPGRRGAERIHAAGQRAADLTRRLLAFSRQQVLQMRVVDLNPLVCAQQGHLQSLAGESIVLLARPAPALGLVKADPQQVIQVLESLTSNAREAMPEGGTLLVETANAELDEVQAFRHERFVQAGPYVMLAVTDTGCGMDEETQSRIFEPFFTTKSRAEATGLGLSSVYGIVKQSGGYVWVYSEPGQGTAVKVYLPRVDENGKPWTGPAASEGPGGTETVLVVDDDAPLREAVCDALAERGFHVLSAPAGSEALRVAETHPGPVHLLLTDVVLPGMTGPELADRFSAARPETRVLYMSGFAGHVAVRQGVIAAGRPLLEKPFTDAALARIVRQSLDGAARSAPPARP